MPLPKHILTEQTIRLIQHVHLHIYTEAPDAYLPKIMKEHPRDLLHWRLLQYRKNEGLI